MLRRGTFSPKEDAFLRKHYRKRKALWCGLQLGRSQPSAYARALRLGLVQPKWSQREIHLLQSLWGLASERVILRRLKGRSWYGISRKARDLGLGNPSQGLCTVAQACVLAGVHRRVLLAACEAAKVHVRYAVRGSEARRKLPDGPHYRRRVVIWEEAEQAVLAWLNREN